MCYPNGLSPKGLWNGVSVPLLPPPLGGGLGGIVVIITSEIELSSTTLKTAGLIYNFPDDILFSMVFKSKQMISKYVTKILLNLNLTNSRPAKGHRFFALRTLLS
jgi:hypothetical protein